MRRMKERKWFKEEELRLLRDTPLKEILLQLRFRHVSHSCWSTKGLNKESITSQDLHIYKYIHHCT